MSLLFYDIEVFKYDSLVVFKDIKNNVVAKFWNTKSTDFSDPNGFEGVPALILNKVLVGYNNYGYDDYILTDMIKGYPQSFIKKLNDRIISGQGPNITVSSLIHSIDTMQQIDTSRPSLKLIEGNMGKSIIESEIGFDIDRELTDEEKRIVEKYCEYDVESTIRVYELRKNSYFDIKDSLVDMLPEDSKLNAKRWNTTTISAALLTNNHNIPEWDELRIPQELWRNVDGIPSDVWDMWEQVTASKDSVVGKGKSKTIKAFGCNIVFGLGGLHGAPSKGGVWEGIDLDDVGSMYPSAIKMLNGLGDATDLYDGMRQERLKIKHTAKAAFGVPYPP